MIEMIFLDVDGWMTDGKIVLCEDGKQTKNFNVKDGAAIEGWLRLKKHCAIITGAGGGCVRERAKMLKIGIVRENVKDKRAQAQQILDELGLTFAQSAAIGDYYNDLGLLGAVKCAFTPKDAAISVGKRLSKRGGDGAIAQMIELLIKKNKMQKEWMGLWL